MTFVIGDIHGEISKLKTLINLILEEDSKPEFVFVGDYIDKGENSKLTLDYLKSLSSTHSCVFLLGNHEYYWMNFEDDGLNAEDYLNRYGGTMTANDFKCNSLKETSIILKSEYKDFLEALVPVWQNEKFLVTHSGLPPEAFTKNLSELRQIEFLLNRYKFIESKELYYGKKVVFGHTGFYDVLHDGFKIGIDTSACYKRDQPISAICLETEYILQSNENKYFLNSIRNDLCPSIVRVKPYRFEGGP